MPPISCLQLLSSEIVWDEHHEVFIHRNSPFLMSCILIASPMAIKLELDGSTMEGMKEYGSTWTEYKCAKAGMYLEAMWKHSVSNSNTLDVFY